MFLHVFAISHYSEKARWAVDRSSLAPRVVEHVPGMHVRSLKRLGVPDTTVPVLQLKDEVIQGSSAILDHLESREPALWTPPTEEERDWEEAAFDGAFDTLEGRLDETRWLSGDVFGRLDLVSAAILAPLARPQEHPFPFGEGHPAVRAWADRYEGRPLTEHILRCYEAFR